MKKIVLVIAGTVLAVVMSNPVAAQQASDQTKLTYDVLVSEWNTLIGGVLDLTETEAEAFWPVYEEYRAERNETIDRRRDLLKIFVGSYHEMTPEMSRILLDQSFALERQKLEVKMKYAEIFDDFLPPNKVTRLFQAENKLETTMNVELAKDVPLTK